MKYIASILLFSLLILVGCNSDKTSESDSSNQVPLLEVENEIIYLSKAQFNHTKMEFGSLEEHEFAQKVHTNGIIDVPPSSKAVISAFSGGFIKNSPLLIGDKVKKGQHLLTIENPDFINMQQNYLETSEQLRFLKSEYERYKTMYEENISSQKNFLKAESEYNTAKARANGLKKSLQLLNINPASVLEGNMVSQVSINSPIDGYITHVYVNTGSYVSPADKIMEIINTEHLHLELKVFEKDLLDIKKGQDILFKIPEASSKMFKGDVHLVGTTIDVRNRTAMIHGHISENDEANFATGMFIEADIVIGTSKQFSLPEDAVVGLEGKEYVLMLDSEDGEGYELHVIEVQMEANYNGFTSFKTQLPKEGKFLTKGGYFLLQVDDGGVD